MDMERFSPYRTTQPAGILCPLPTTVELTGFSDGRSFLEQQDLPRCGTARTGVDLSPLDSRHL
ncbi:hypothetical protein ACFFLZ_11355 [Photobacterium aphoticum]|uniref:Uncharacterized protein n=1 Tax=Photobacterium aphoticum TaxID=754436 RepID=A0A090QSK2_9GAMM|nr:hypothetical protein [Photobacterium aphoticum]KLU99606.1 hypothetical protein ABT58_16095 [Photobacterium aphoticum]PSU52726.1 hypothetical protein C9I90_21410 [Photobacterium aphoticum]GAL05876.1 hypothetical protein JCM19237_4949 [Photobacterium aphoticum]GHA44404.1 hypothetical protein GCM10007086_17670 [Photobacterium aphoticum]